ncbi:bifunctional glutamate N-acetyltransferase/amino-acid acetyltransferase ArgJ [Miniphocaeibacter halophilus]|uniref:Bifunctional glutamate N-acetyltransferase/amino-acid acetyltransferase ArgJ n=1 Tax=Miniphocaeibacter halophilus TaxID=2931922 RepID=A0AC61MQA4_9FIRM|nr:bifunctional glutamate N-acetyltransferase/amino-acid acetyltransferase ArgJ [Miniphocaeibacter halophilus]QQK07794.1 bifunctional glutamate N-acetyltransferase/amino-acid acetyltransferase ArgJ [Miniphocaeibacter halophilus]
MKEIEGGIVSPKGFYSTGVKAGIKKDSLDMAAIYSEVPASIAGTFTQNIVKAAPVVWDRKIVDDNLKSQLIIINSGIANAAVGTEGLKHCEETALEAEEIFNLDKNSVLLASTGLIGAKLPMDKIINGVSLLRKNLNNSSESANLTAEAILTTDTKKKEIAVELELDNKIVKIAGICKGSGMIHPDMCTMLAFITTDISIDDLLLKKCTKEIVDDTFNMISVDGDTSTNDTVLVMANGLAKNNKITKETEEYNKFKDALKYVFTYLAKKIAEDGEGATKLFEVKVKGASTVKQAKKIAKSVVTSNLTKAALFGNDANWGRIFCAMGYAGEHFDPLKVDLNFISTAGNIEIVKNGVAEKFNEEKAVEILSQKEVLALIDLKEGNCEATAWGCDLTYEYVRINGEYRS